MTTVLAQGTFDILHPGHLHYLREAAAEGNELHVVVARSTNVTHKQPPILSGSQRREMVGALEMVDEAHLGHPEDPLQMVEKVNPDIIVLGHDQHHNVDRIEQGVKRRGFDCEVKRASPRDPTDDEILSSRKIIQQILDERRK
ncbi:FAD synthase [Salinarchaeum sp. IM2453]|uniref:adenylyltransferase/cytidyltransferase family protein n=1 Tax=Salinarchaeum sp. IM2453 TaxID=2862870 RepID=UPI001C8307EE|nr:adenylyltransferase/cytidyltransferase family protein [Salinarchaeum sp. IM2453]QZA88839.1 FAD synthase [Salinarchaeum sp. IM2453]